MSNTNYGIDDADGNQMTTGLQECNAARVAQSMADRHNKTVYLYELGSDADPVAYEPTSTEPVIIASNPRASTYVEVAGAVDVDVTVDGVEGEVTLAPRQYDGGLAAYGSDPSMWVSGALLASLTNGRSLREVLDAIEAAAVEVC